MKKQGILIFATEEAKKNYKGKIKKEKSKNCPSCEIKTYIRDFEENNVFDIKEIN